MRQESVYGLISCPIPTYAWRDRGRPRN